MKNRTVFLAAVLVLVMLFTASCAFADTDIAADAVADTTAETIADTTGENNNDPLVGSWRMPPSPVGDDFSAYVVLKADGSFFNATNLYDSGNSGPYTQTVVTNDSFYWVRTGRNTLELHYDYHDDNGEFVTELTYDPMDDKLYFGEEVYAFRDDSFVLNP